MICFEISINGKKKCTAGVDCEFGSLSSILTWVKRDSSKFPEDKTGRMPAEELKYSVGGYISHGKNDDEYVDWINTALAPGDEILIKIVESSDSDQPISIKRTDPNLVEKEKRKYFEKLKKEYE